MDREKLAEAVAFWDKGAEVHGYYPTNIGIIVAAARRLLADLEQTEREDMKVSRGSGFDSRGDEYGGPVQFRQGERGADPAFVDQPEESPHFGKGRNSE